MGNIFLFGMACRFSIILISILISADDDASPSMVNFCIASFTNPSALLYHCLRYSLDISQVLTSTAVSTLKIPCSNTSACRVLLTEPFSSISHAHPVVHAENDQWHLDGELKIVQRKRFGQEMNGGKPSHVYRKAVRTMDSLRPVCVL